MLAVTDRSTMCSLCAVSSASRRIPSFVDPSPGDPDGGGKIFAICRLSLYTLYPSVNVAKCIHLLTAFLHGNQDGMLDVTHGPCPIPFG